MKKVNFIFVAALTVLIMASHLAVAEASKTAEYQQPTQDPKGVSQSLKSGKAVYKKVNALPKGLVIDEKAGKPVLKDGLQGGNPSAPVYQKIDKEPAEIVAMRKQQELSQNSQKQVQAEYKKISEPPAGMKVPDQATSETK